MSDKALSSITRKKPKHSKPPSVWTRNKEKKSTLTSWFEVVNDDKNRLVIPVGPRFQASVPEWKGPLNNEGVGDSSSKWLGTNVWPTEDSECIKNDDLEVGRGRSDFCLCPLPGSVECAKRHILTKRVKLMVDLGNAFWTWKFDEMGEDVTKLWNSEEEIKFKNIARTNPKFLGKSDMKRTLECLDSQTKKSVVSYYFNVYIPRRMSALTRSGIMVVDTDDETLKEEKSSPKFSRKRFRPNTSTSSSDCKYPKTMYLKVRR